MTARTHPGAPLRLRLLGAFAGVAAAAIAAFAGLTLWASHGDVTDLVHRQQQTTATEVTAALVDAYRAASGWTNADLRPARAIAVSSGALLEVRDAGGTLLLQAARGLGPGAGAGLGAQLATSYGDPLVMAVEVAGAEVGSAAVSFPKGVLPPAERQLWEALTRTTVYGVLIAAAVALVIGLAVAEGIVRPLRRLTGAVRRLGAGDRAARANLDAPGELGELATAVDAMAAALEREDELRRALTADVAHELRTPVTILAIQCEAMLDGIEETGPEQISSLHDEVLRLGRVIEDLETLASADAAVQRLERTEVELAALVDEQTRMYSRRFDAAGIVLATMLAPARVSGDEVRLAQIVRNLLSNALKFTPAGGRVEVTLATADQEATLTVADTGPGIPPEDIPHVFERFWRGSNGPATAGSGVGLAVVDQLSRAHGGRASVESEPGRGARFTVTLPTV